jgi:AraC family transcriptional regulator of adaptative response/methylated-DNA-[protein]-cysteine methyltransferase
MYNALLKRDETYEGVFFVGVKTTGIFCRPVCPARKPKLENIEFFKSINQAVKAGYKPCKRCKPLELKGSFPKWMEQILSEVDNDPGKRWKDYEIRNLGVDPNKVRRWFKSSFNMTFHEYTRYRRLGMAIGNIKEGENLIQTAFNSGFESLSGFNDAVKKLTGNSPAKTKDSNVVLATRILTPLGPMIAMASEKGVCLLEFVERKMLETQIKRVMKYLNCIIVPGFNIHLKNLKTQINEYFSGKRTKFELPLNMPGTKFQLSVWKQLQKLPYGKTTSYEDIAIKIENKNAVRAVATANGDNRFAILIPCHRVIGKDGKLRGYGGGLWRKKWLLEFEQRSQMLSN